MKEIRLNLGSGNSELAGYVNLDRKKGNEIFPLRNYDKESVDEIRASHVLEHFGHAQTVDVLKDWYNKLKTGGRIRIAVPDFKKIAQKYIDGENISTTGYICGGQIDENDFHKNIFDHKTLKGILEHVGFVDIQNWQSEDKDCSSLDISLNLQAFKRNGQLINEQKNSQPLDKTVQIDCSQIGAIMSIPRLIFSDNIFCAVSELLPLGIILRKGTGVFWGQILTRMINEIIDLGKKYVLTIDYDTYFTKEQFLYLVYLMNENPDVDAIAPLQIIREGGLPMLGLIPPDLAPEGATTHNIGRDIFRKPLTDVVTAHFGLTLIRVSALKKMSKPWFCARPAPDGGWGEGRLDSDISFWDKFHKEGFRACIANYCGIGHLQLKCSFPGTLEDNWKPIEMYMIDVHKNGVPKCCLPSVSLEGLVSKVKADEVKTEETGINISETSAINEEG